MSRSIFLLVGAMAVCCTASLPAQDVVLGQKYGQGVHAYFSGDYANAYEQLTAAINGGSKDPRVYYYRGLAYLKLGRPQEATLDFRKGAELESRDVNKFYNAAKALERVQGTARVELENYRVDARMAAMQEAEKIRKARYEAIEQEEGRVVREQKVLTEGGQEVQSAPEVVAAGPFDSDSVPEPVKNAVKKEKKSTDNSTVTSSAKSTKPKGSAAISKDPFADSDTDEASADEDQPAPDTKATNTAKSTPKSKTAATAKKGSLLGALRKAVKAGVVGKADGSKDATAIPSFDGPRAAPRAKTPAADENVPSDEDPFLRGAPATDGDQPAAEEEPAAEDNS